MSIKKQPNHLRWYTYDGWVQFSYFEVLSIRTKKKLLIIVNSLTHHLQWLKQGF